MLGKVTVRGMTRYTLPALMQSPHRSPSPQFPSRIRIGGGGIGPLLDPVKESVLAQVVAGAAAQAATGVKPPPVVEVSGEDDEGKGIVRAPPSS